jgi:hypothetical protein
MTGASDRGADFDLDLVEYVVVTTPEPARLTTLAAALTDLVRQGQIQILDLVLIATDPQTSRRRAIEVGELLGPSELDGLSKRAGSLLSEHDIQLVATALEPTETALLVLVEGRWAAPLSSAARQVGGRVAGGERIPRARVAAAVARLGPEQPEP